MSKDIESALRLLEDKEAALDALLRFARGLDTRDAGLIASAFAPDCVADFSEVGGVLGFEFPPLVGREQIAAMATALPGMVTTHIVSNVRMNLEEDVGTMEAYVEAYIEAEDKSDPERYVLLKNHYEMRVVREASNWTIQHLKHQNIWWQGDSTIVTSSLVVPD